MKVVEKAVNSLKEITNDEERDMVMEQFRLDMELVEDLVSELHRRITLLNVYDQKERRNEKINIDDSPGTRLFISSGKQYTH